MKVLLTSILLCVYFFVNVDSFTPAALSSHFSTSIKSTSTDESATQMKEEKNNELLPLFEEFSSFLQKKQKEIIADIENIDSEKFSNDRWGMFEEDCDPSLKSGGITRVIQGGKVVEKGACSLTLLRGGKLTAERAASIQGRQGKDAISVKEGDEYYAAALSMVLHTRSPLVPTFRSDVRVFMVKPSEGEMVAWFGGGSDLTPYYLFDEDIVSFHQKLKALCDEYKDDDECKMVDYHEMKKLCDEYFYLPARDEHRGVGGMFFDDMPATAKTMQFVQAVTDNWMPSWFPIVDKRNDLEFTEQQRQWQLLRRGRYLVSYQLIFFV